MNCAAALLADFDKIRHCMQKIFQTKVLVVPTGTSGFLEWGLQDMGVCPDASQAGAASANSVRMLDYSYINGVLRVEFERPLNASDRFDW